MLGSNIDIFRTEWLNVVFAGRNQAYGAYELRRENPRNTNNALIIAISLFIFALATPTIANWVRHFIPKSDAPIKVTTVNLMPPPMLEKVKVVPPPPVHEAARPHTTEVRFPPPVVRDDRQAHEDPPTDKQLVDVNPGQKNLRGDENAPIDVDEKEHGNSTEHNVTEATNNDAPFTAVEINPEYPGGEAAFGKFLQKNIHYPTVAKENNIQGRVYVQFIVERDGSLTDIKVMREPGSGLGDEAIRVLKISPHWKPGIQNGKPVRVQYTVPVNFSLGDQ